MAREYQIALSRWYQWASKTLESSAPNTLRLSADDLSLALAERLEALVEEVAKINSSMVKLSLLRDRELSIIGGRK